MNQEPDVERAQREISAKQQLEEAIKNYLEVCERPDENLLPNGVLTGWYVVTEEIDVISGKAANIRVVRDLQSPSSTMGLITYSDEYYRNKVRYNF